MAGDALARLGDVAAADVLTGALERLDPTFIRAETALRVDLAVALSAMGDHDGAQAHARRAERLAIEIGSTRQQHRIRSLPVIRAGVEGAP